MWNVIADIKFSFILTHKIFTSVNMKVFSFFHYINFPFSSVFQSTVNADKNCIVLRGNLLNIFNVGRILK
jgi:hypothetical protein